jgi:hypothetical protein
MAGLVTVANRRAALVGGLLLATNYAFIMWNRAALMESTVTAFIVCAWAAYAVSERRPSWGALAGLLAAAAWFTKANAAFFLAALVVDAGVQALLAMRLARGREAAARWRAAVLTVGGLSLALLIVGVLFVLPHWREYQFYNWQMSVERKPSYHLKDFQNRVSYLLGQGFFSRMWLVVVVGFVALMDVLRRWRTAAAGERLLVLWMAIGLLELVVHDSGNERRYVMFIPAVIALAAMFVSRPGPGARLSSLGHHEPRWSLVDWTLMLSALLPVGYLVVGTLLRPFFTAAIEARDYSGIVRLSALGAVLLTGAAVLWRRPLLRRLENWRAPTAVLAVVFVVTVVSNGAEYLHWARVHDDKNYEASVAVGQVLPPGTLVQGKLANGLALDNRIRPLFIGVGFGNYADRLQRDDVRYILTYDLPQLGYESQRESGMIPDLIDHYPNHRTIATFDVDETPGPDRAVLIDKSPASPQPQHARD